MSLTTDRNDPDLQITEDSGMQKKYLILSKEKRQQGFVRPLRQTYVHQYKEDGSSIPYPLISMKDIKGCGAATKMGIELSETYARDPKFYGATYCVGCKTHLPVKEFTWEDHEVVGS